MKAKLNTCPGLLEATVIITTDNNNSLDSEVQTFLLALVTL